MQPFVAYFLLGTAQTSIALNIVIGKVVLQEGMPIFLFLAFRFFVAGVILTIMKVFLKTKIASLTHPTGKLHVKDWGFLLAQAFTGGFLFNFLFYTGVEYTTVTSAGIISSTLPMMIALCAWIFLKERLTRAKIFAIILAMLGILTISLDNAMHPAHISGSYFGDFLVLLAMLPEALYSIFNKYIGDRQTPFGSALVVNWLIFLMLLPLSIDALRDVHPSDYPLFCWVMVFIGGVLSSYFFWSWPKGLLSTQASTAAIFCGVIPIVTALFGWLLLGEGFSWYDATGMFLVLLSLYIGTKVKVRGA